MGTKIVALSELCKISGRIGWKGYTVDDLREEGPLVIGANDIDSNHQLDLKEVKHISREKYEESPEIMIDKYDILIVKVGSTIGKVAIVDQDLGEACINPNTVLLKNCKINPFYIYYTLISSYGQSFLLNNSSASAQPALNQTTLKEMPIHLPEDENWINNITKSLNRINSKIKLNNRINSELEAMAKTLYDYWFVQFDFPNEQGKPYKSSGGKMVYNAELKREIPEGWEVKLLCSEIEIQRGISYTSKEINGEGIPMINLNSFNLDGTYKPDGVKSYSGKYSEKNILKSGDLLIAATDVTRNADIIGRAILVPDYYSEDLVFSMDIAKIISSNIPSSFLMMLFNSSHYHNYIKWYATGTLVLHLNLDGVSRYKTEIPSNNILKMFDKFYLPIADRIYMTTKQNQQLSELRDWLLPMLMNGQVTVKESEESLSMAAEPSVEYKKG